MGAERTTGQTTAAPERATLEAIVHHASKVRPNPSGFNVGGHQVSSASVVTLMTALWRSRRAARPLIRAV